MFEALDLATGDAVAVKVLQPGSSADAHLEFEGECEILGVLAGSSNVVTSLASGKDALPITVAGSSVVAQLDIHFVALELADACLVELLLQRNLIGWEDRLQLYRGVAKGIHQMHLDSIVHRDLKSENVLLFSRRGNTADSKVSDFGRSRRLNRPPRFTLAQYLHGRGDLRFAPPELLWLQATDTPSCWRRVDLYHLGSVLFELATGQGITNLAIGDPFAVINQAAQLSPAERARRFASVLPDLRTRYEAVYAIFRQELPPILRHEAMNLVRQLCDPDAALRDPRLVPSMRNRLDLQWLLRRIDIMLLLLRTSERKLQRKTRKAV